MTQLLFAVCMALAACRPLPAALATPLYDSADALTSIVVADIDRDGDADVVATDGALHLFVWINDGTGRLTRQRPAPAHSDVADTERPGVERSAPSNEPYTPTDPPALDAPALAGTEAALVDGASARTTSDPHRDRPQTANRLRGPPPGSPLR